MLHQAAATGLGMRTGRFDPIDRRRQNAKIGKLVALQIAFHLFAGQHAGHKDRPVWPLRHAVAQMPKPIDGNFHSAASFSSVPMKPPDWRFQ